MAKKRFTDIEIWDKEWYMDLKPVHKCLMKYIFDKCDASGCWKPNWKLASVHIGESVNFSDLNQLPKDQYEVLENGKIFIIDFVNFQYGKISKKSPAHNPVFIAIEKNGLLNRVFNRVSNTLQEEDIDKEKEKEEEKEKEKNAEKVILWEKVVEDFGNDFKWKEKFCRDKNVSMPELESKMKEFVSDIELREKFKELKELKDHFFNWFQKNKNTNGFHKHEIELSEHQIKMEQDRKSAKNKKPE